MLIIKNSYLVEVPLTTIANNQRYFFPDIPRLRNRNIVGASAITSTILSISPAGNTVVANARAYTVTLVQDVQGGNQESIFQIPYFDLVAPSNGGIIKQFRNLKINLVKSYITLNDASLSTAGHSAALVFYYE